MWGSSGNIKTAARQCTQWKCSYNKGVDFCVDLQYDHDELTEELLSLMNPADSSEQTQSETMNRLVFNLSLYLIYIIIMRCVDKMQCKARRHWLIKSDLCRVVDDEETEELPQNNPEPRSSQTDPDSDLDR